MNVTPLTDHRKVLINPTFNDIRAAAKESGWTNWDSWPIWFEKDGEPQVKIIMRRLA